MSGRGRSSSLLGSDTLGLHRAIILILPLNVLTVTQIATLQSHPIESSGRQLVTDVLTD